jgi:hypothetical protein
MNNSLPVAVRSLCQVEKSLSLLAIIFVRLLSFHGRDFLFPFIDFVFVGKCFCTQSKNIDFQCSQAEFMSMSGNSCGSRCARSTFNSSQFARLKLKTVFGGLVGRTTFSVRFQVKRNF